MLFAGATPANTAKRQTRGAAPSVATASPSDLRAVANAPHRILPIISNKKAVRVLEERAYAVFPGQLRNFVEVVAPDGVGVRVSRQIDGGVASRVWRHPDQSILLSVGLALPCVVLRQCDDELVVDLPNVDLEFKTRLDG